MISTKPPTAAQKRFHKAVREMGCCLSDETYNVQLHHVKGGSYKHNKVWIGQWYVLALHFDLHDVSSNDPLNVTHHKNAFEGHFGTQASLWLGQLTKLKWMMGKGHIKFDKKDLPPPEVVAAIETLNIY